MELRVKIARIQMAQQSSINSWKNQAEPRQSQTEPGTGQDKAKPSKAKQNQAEPRRTRQHQAGQGRTRQNPAEPGRTIYICAHTIYRHTHTNTHTHACTHACKHARTCT